MAIRQATCRLLDWSIRRRLAPFARDDWTASAVIIAPHPDDETLGCGGVACKKIANGAEVRFVFVTDGATSHAAQVGSAALRRIRAQEAIDATGRLGADPDRVAFLDFPDGQASAHVPEIARRVAALLHEWRPQSVYVVHGGDPSPDHRAVHLGVSEAIRSYGGPLTVFEYPVWYWYHWPWIGFRGDLPGMWRTTARQTARTAAGLMSLGRLNAMADISDVTDAKRQALAAHRSQTERPAGARDWPILRDLGRGGFLARLVSDYEAFLRYEANVWPTDAGGLRRR